MKKSLYTILIYSSLMSCKNDQKKHNNVLNYPKTSKKEVVDNYFDNDVRDPYRWLEDDRSKETGWFYK